MSDLTPDEAERQLALLADIERAKARSGEAHARAAEAVERDRTGDRIERAELRRQARIQQDRDQIIEGYQRQRDRHYQVARALLLGKDEKWEN